MNIQHLLLSAIIISSSTNVVATNETPTQDKTKIKTEVITDTHTIGRTTAVKNKPFWSEEQIRQAELEKKYKQKIAGNSDDRQAYTNLAGLYLINNKTTKAIDAYQDAITHDPENPKLFAAISIAYLHQSKYTMARAMADEALRLDPTMKQVSKINEYISAKETAIKAASSVSLEDAHKPGTLSDPAPKDGMHGNKNSVLQIDDPSKWSKSQ